MSTHLPGLQSCFLHHFLLAKLATSSIMVNSIVTVGYMLLGHPVWCSMCVRGIFRLPCDTCAACVYGVTGPSQWSLCCIALQPRGRVARPLQ